MGTPLILILFNYYIIPYVVFVIVQYEKHELKSEKEDSFLSKNLFYMIVNSLILPFFAFVLITYLKEYPDFDMPPFPKPTTPVNSSSFGSINATEPISTSYSLNYLYTITFDPLNMRFAEILSYSQCYYLGYII